jgi:hypothetical protein
MKARGGACRSFAVTPASPVKTARKPRKENEKKDSGTPTNADSYPPHLAMRRGL